MRVLQVVKTADGARWAAHQAAELVKLGVEVHVSLPEETGRRVPDWRASGAVIHKAALDFPLKRPWRFPAVARAARELVSAVEPDLIHSHFVGTTLLLRMALGRDHPVPRVFQVPGPLHLEHPFYRRREIALAGSGDFWVGSSKYIVDLYRKAGISADRVFLSYYGTRNEPESDSKGVDPRVRFGLRSGSFVVGNVNFIYPPKYYLGQRVGLKGHEDLIDGLALALADEPNLEGVIVGGVFGRSAGYEGRLRRRALRAGGGRIHMVGYLSGEEVRDLMPGFDCVVHVPLSENCGGVVEPLLAGVPVIAGRVGGLPEVVIDGLTGLTVPIRNPRAFSWALRSLMADVPAARARAIRGQRLAGSMFAVERTAGEIARIYEHILDRDRPAPQPFDTRVFLRADVDSGENKSNTGVR